MEPVTCEPSSISLRKAVEHWVADAWRPQLAKASAALVISGLVLLRLGQRIGRIR